MANHYRDIEAIYRRGRPVNTPLVIIGIDPGPEQTAYAVLNQDYALLWASLGPLEEIYASISERRPDRVVIEDVLIYQKAAHHVRDTAYIIGRIQRQCQLVGIPYIMIPRPTYATAICGMKANDAILRQALALRFGGYGKGEPLALLRGTTDKRAAFAVAAYYLDCQKGALCHDLSDTHTQSGAHDGSANNKRAYASRKQKRERS